MRNQNFLRILKIPNRTSVEEGLTPLEWPRRVAFGCHGISYLLSMVDPSTLRSFFKHFSGLYGE